MKQTKQPKIHSDQKKTVDEFSPSVGNGMGRLEITADILRRVISVGNRKGLPCTIDPDEVELEP
jgi:hypothetical protein